MKQAIRLTNKTAIALRKSAQKVRRAYLAAAIIISVLLGAAGVALGFLRLWAVPLMIAVIALIDSALMVASRSRYLSLLGQAICTEAAAREISAEKTERKRREQMEKDLMRMKEDIRQTVDMQPGAQPFFEEKEEEKEEEEPAYPAVQKTDAPHRRRRKNTLELIRSETAK